MSLLTPISTGTPTEVVAQQLRGKRFDLWGTVFQVVLLLALLTSFLVLGVLLADVVRTGWPVLSTRLGSFLTSPLRSLPEEAGVYQGLVGSFWIAVIVAVIAFPLGIGAAVYLEEYAPRNRLTNFINVNIRNLAGVPSIVYGILGLAIFVQAMSGATGGATLVSAGITLAVLALPIVIITAAEAIRAVPHSLREAGFGVGATRYEVIRHHVMPYAAPGVLTGTVLALARAIGEAAPLILVGAITGRLASDYRVFDLEQLRERFTAMPIIIAEWAGDPNPGFRALTGAAIVVMLVFVLALNGVAILLRNRFEKKRG
jgi:phosphate transport system permease protein